MKGKLNEISADARKAIPGVNAHGAIVVDEIEATTAFQKKVARKTVAVDEACRVESRQFLGDDIEDVLGWLALEQCLYHLTCDRRHHQHVSRPAQRLPRTPSRGKLNLRAAEAGGLKLLRDMPDMERTG